MKKTLISAAFLVACSSNVNAFSQETHKRIVIDAVNYMQQHPSTTQYAALVSYAQQNNMTVTQLGELLGQAAYDVDDFEDTFFVVLLQVLAYKHQFGVLRKVL